MEKPMNIRTPRVSRTAIYPRSPVSSIPIKYETCKLCNGFTDCQGRHYLSPNHSDSNYKVLHVCKDFEDWNKLVESIWDLNESGVLLRLVIDDDIPQGVLWAASYNCKNILQINVNMLEVDMLWVHRLMGWSNSCGMYSVLFLFPIVPTVVKTNHVIRIMDSLVNCGCHHFSLKFVEFCNCVSKNGYVNFNGQLISSCYFSKTSGKSWCCTSSYLETFMEKVNLYVIPRKISVSVCGTLQDCTGLGG